MELIFNKETLKEILARPGADIQNIQSIVIENGCVTVNVDHTTNEFFKVKPIKK